MNALYFAYGSNMDAQQMARRCPKARALSGAAFLPGFRLAFSGWSIAWGGAVAAIRPDKSAVVHGRVWRCDETSLAALDKFEGFPKFYQRDELEVRWNGAVYEARVYYMPQVVLGVLPSEAYLARIISGYKQMKYNRRALGRAVKESSQ